MSMFETDAMTIRDGSTVDVERVRGTVWGVNGGDGRWMVSHVPSGARLAVTTCRKVATMGALLAAWCRPNQCKGEPIPHHKVMERRPYLFAVAFAVNSGGISSTGDGGFDAAVEMLADASDSAEWSGCACESGIEGVTCDR